MTGHDQRGSSESKTKTNTHFVDLGLSRSKPGVGPFFFLSLPFGVFTLLPGAPPPAALLFLALVLLHLHCRFSGGCLNHVNTVNKKR